MNDLGRTAIAIGLALSAGICLAQKTAAPGKTAVATKLNCQVLLMAPATGEPVPGAEILIEQEPNDAARMARTTLVTDSRGIAAFTLTAPGTVKVTMKLAVAQLGELKKKSPKADKARLVLRVTAGKTVVDHPVEVMLNSTSAVSSGPFSQSLSNIEDN